MLSRPCNTALSALRHYLAEELRPEYAAQRRFEMDELTGSSVALFIEVTHGVRRRIPLVIDSVVPTLFSNNERTCIARAQRPDVQVMLFDEFCGQLCVQRPILTL